MMEKFEPKNITKGAFKLSIWSKIMAYSEMLNRLKCPLALRGLVY